MSLDQRENRLSSISVSVNGEAVSVSEGSTIADLLGKLKMNSRAIAVEVNHELKPRDQHAVCVLQADDVLEIVTLAGGG